MQRIGTFVAKISWWDWEVIKPWLWWDGSCFRDGLSFNQHNIWWSLLIWVQGLPLALVPRVYGLQFHKDGIRTP